MGYIYIYTILMYVHTCNNKEEIMNLKEELEVGEADMDAVLMYEVLKK